MDIERAHNTYVELTAGRPRLFVFREEEITDRQTIAFSGDDRFYGHLGIGSARSRD